MQSNRTLLLLAAATAILVLPSGAIWKDFDDAEKIIGQPGLPSPTRLFQPEDITISPASGKVFVADGGNNRVLRFSSAAALANGGAAEAVFGQPNLYSSDRGLAQDKIEYPSGLAIDSAGRLWVADHENNRVLRWDNADTAASGAPAAQVLGQPDFTSRVADATAVSLSRPQGLAVDAQGRLWVADYFNNRVLRYDNPSSKGNGGTADGVVGQANFTSGVWAATAINLNQPSDVDVDAQGRLWVCDFNNARVLRYDNPTAQNQPVANGVLGQADFTSVVKGAGPALTDRAVTIKVTPSGSLFVMDTQNSRILRWDNAAARGNGANADGVLGRAGFEQNAFYSNLPGGISDETRGMAFDAAGRLWTVDRHNERVLRWDNATAKANGANADGVIGFANTSSIASSLYNPATAPGQVRGGLEDPVSGKFFLADYGRVLRFASRGDAENGNPPEAALGKPSLGDINFEGASATDLGSTWGLAMDASGKLWVSDPQCSRVVAFANATTAPTGAAMAIVLGQQNFTSTGDGLSSTTLDTPRGLALDSAGNLYVADYGNNRVLRFNNVAARTSGAAVAADAVIGQQDLVTSVGGANAALLSGPSGVAIDSAGRLWVADTGKNRVVRYNTPLTTQPLGAASGILGGDGVAEAYGMSLPTALAVDATGRLFVMDRGFNRVLIFNNAVAKANGADANNVLGAPNFSYAPYGGRSSRSFAHPYGLFLDAGSNLWVGDEDNRRLMRFSPESTAYITQSGSSGAQFTLTFHGEAGIPYKVTSSTDLKIWQEEGSYTLGAPGLQVFAKNRSGVKRFYRVEEP